MVFDTCRHVSNTTRTAGFGAGWREARTTLGQASSAAALPTRRGRSLQIEWSGFAVHIDDKHWLTRRRSHKGTIAISLYGDGVEFLVPA